MVVLGIETSGVVGSVALCDEERTLAAFRFPEGARHARDMVPAVDQVVREAGLTREQIGAVAVSQGPGSFTGLRIGVTCAKTLAYALGWRAVGVPSLEVLMQNLRARAAGDHACPVRDARRQRVYATLFRWDGTRWRDTTGVLLVAPEELVERLPEGTLVFGPGVRAHADRFSSGRLVGGARELEVGHAEAVARLGMEKLRAGEAGDPMALMPLYYRVTEAEEKLGAQAASL
jgi:tRNA threonylcarbamoyladenosine biosynthesis protein TsaB